MFSKHNLHSKMVQKHLLELIGHDPPKNIWSQTGSVLSHVLRPQSHAGVTMQPLDTDGIGVVHFSKCNSVHFLRLSN